jgi:hypothetical protein
MSEWDTLVSSALLGTERQPPALPDPGGAAGGLLAGVPREDPAKAVLSAAAVMHLRRRAGWQPPLDTLDAPAAADVETRPACSTRSARHLAMMLGGEFRAVLPEWLEAAAGAGKIVAPELLPELLQSGVSAKELRPLIGPVLGNRGAWLAGHVPEWQFSATSIDPADWETGNRETRTAVLQHLRETDPGAGRELLLSTWGQETSEERARFVGLFATGLGPSDETFLEERLDDRRKEVRQTAAELLRLLPESRLSRRMAARVETLVQLQRGFLGRTSLQVQLPAECDKAMQRDGIEPKPPYDRRIGERAWWLQAVIAATPLSHWREAARLEPAQLLDLASKHEWAEPLVTGLAEAAARQRSEAWVNAVLESRAASIAQLESLMTVLTEPARPAQARKRLRDAHAPRGDHPAMGVLSHCRGPWSVELAREMVKAVHTRIRGGATAHQDWTLRSLMKQFALYVPPELLPEIETRWPTDAKDWAGWEKCVNEFLAVLTFRREMLEEINR